MGQSGAYAMAVTAGWAARRVGGDGCSGGALQLRVATAARRRSRYPRGGGGGGNGGAAGGAGAHPVGLRDRAVTAWRHPAPPAGAGYDASGDTSVSGAYRQRWQRHQFG